METFSSMKVTRSNLDLVLPVKVPIKYHITLLVSKVVESVAHVSFTDPSADLGTLLTCALRSENMSY